MQILDGAVPVSYTHLREHVTQFVVNDGSHVYFLDHGDAYYRGLILSSFSAYSGGYIAQDHACLLYTSRCV